MQTILSVGLDANLLSTRHQVLRMAGVSVTSAAPEDALSLMSEEQFTLILICHTVSDLDALAICWQLDRAQCAGRVILLEKAGQRTVRGYKLSEGFSCLRGPGALLGLVRTLLDSTKTAGEARSSLGSIHGHSTFASNAT